MCKRVKVCLNIYKTPTVFIVVDMSLRVSETTNRNLSIYNSRFRGLGGAARHF